MLRGYIYYGKISRSDRWVVRHRRVHRSHGNYPVPGGTIIAHSYTPPKGSGHPGNHVCVHTQASHRQR